MDIGVNIKWNVPDSDETYDLVQIHRATSEEGNYTEIASQAISDDEYFDVDGDGTKWYKVKFEEASSGDTSAWSEAIKGGTFVGICTPDDVRTFTKITESDMSNTEMWNLIQFTQAMFSKDINSVIIEEKVRSIDNTRENDIDGSNTDYYVQRSFRWCIGDITGDGEVTADDVTVWQYDADDVKTKLTVSSVDAELGKITLATAPESQVDLTITYAYSPVNVSKPDMDAKVAVTMLTAAMSYMRLDAADYERLSIGKLSMARKAGNQSSWEVYMTKYKSFLSKIKSRLLRRTFGKEGGTIYP